MHIEVQVALNFVISYLYNKLPRRRVNIFGEELERALKDKFRGHWYPEKPFRGSAFRCLKTGDPVDPVLERAARESGVPVQDILENLPSELAVWVDPGEVSYRIGEKGAVKILFNDKHDLSDECLADREVTKTFNPEAQCFRPIEAHHHHHHHHHLVPGAGMPGGPGLPSSKPDSPVPQPPNGVAPGLVAVTGVAGQPVSSSTVGPAPNGVGPVVTVAGAGPVNGVVPATSSAPSPIPSPVAPFLPRSAATLTFTTATFAQTKFGSTKLKTNSKRANRMSPTEFSNYIKQRAMQQQQQQLHHHAAGAMHHLPPPSQLSPQGPQGPQGGAPQGRSLSPNALAAAAAALDHNGFFFQQPSFQPHFGPPGGTSAGPGPRGLFDSPYLDMYSNGSSGTSKFQAGPQGAQAQGAQGMHNSPSSNFLDASMSHQYYGGSGSNAFGGGAASPGAGSGGVGGAPSSNPGVIGSSSSSQSQAQAQSSAEKQLLDGFSNFGLGPHPGSSSQYQHLLVAN